MQHAVAPGSCGGANQRRRVPLSRRCQCKASTAAPTTRVLEYTALEGNTFKLRFGSSGTTVRASRGYGKLVVVADPWLVGPLTFGPPALAALYKGIKPSGDQGVGAARDAQVLLLSQGLDDHAHRPTLEALDKRVPVVASPTGAAVARECGFTSVTSLAHGQSAVVAGLRFVATQGALVGPPWSTRENGFFISHVDDGTVVYYEPHLDYNRDSVASALQSVGGRCDLAIVPTTQVSLAGYPLVFGTPSAVLDLIALLQPKVLVPLRNDQIQEEGAIAPLVQFAEPAINAVRAQLQGKQTQIVEASPTGNALRLEL